MTDSIHIKSSFNMQETLRAQYYNAYESKLEEYFVQTRFQIETSETILPNMHHIDKGVNPTLRPEETSKKDTEYPCTNTCSH